LIANQPKFGLVDDELKIEPVNVESKNTCNVVTQDIFPPPVKSRRKVAPTSEENPKVDTPRTTLKIEVFLKMGTRKFNALNFEGIRGKPKVGLTSENWVAQN